MTTTDTSQVVYEDFEDPGSNWMPSENTDIESETPSLVVRGNDQGSQVQKLYSLGTGGDCSYRLCLDISLMEGEDVVFTLILKHTWGEEFENFQLSPGSVNCFNNLLLPDDF